MTIEMTLSKGNILFDEFYRTVYNATTNEPYANRFKQLSQAGNRQGMIELVMDIPYVLQSKVAKSYQGKNDVHAIELYEKSIGMVVNGKNKYNGEPCACNTLTEALFAASVSSRVFLNALLERARCSYNSGAFSKCTKDCKCMLMLPEKLYDESTDTAKHFSECRKECIYLERECSRKLQACRRKAHGKKVPRGSRVSAPTRKHDSTTPTVDGKQHDSLESCSDAVAVRYDDIKGRQLVATRDIKAGYVLIVDQPFSFTTDKEALQRNCLHCHASLRSNDGIRIPCRSCTTVSYCSENCRAESWEAYHRYECSIFDLFYENEYMVQPQRSSHLLLAYRMTIAGALLSDSKYTETGTKKISVLNDKFLRCHLANDNENTNDGIKNKNESVLIGTKRKYSPLDYETVLHLETHCADMEPNANLVRTIEAIFLTKCFLFSLCKTEVDTSTFKSIAVAMMHHLQTINCNAYEIVENVRDETTHVWEPRNVGGAIYSTVSLVNHSCYPNVVRHSYPGGIVVVRTVRFVPKGSEILDCYGPHFLIESRLARREYLWKKYRFFCTCLPCLQNWQSPLSSTIFFKCGSCSGNDSSPTEHSGTDNEDETKCTECRKNLNLEKIKKQLRKSTEKRLSAISKMFEGNYEEGLPLLLEHAQFVDKFLAAPNVEAVKTQQCIIQCYNSFGCTSVK